MIMRSLIYYTLQHTKIILTLQILALCPVLEGEGVRETQRSLLPTLQHSSEGHSVDLTSGQGVTAMVKQLPKWTVCASASRLLAINGIKTLVDEEPQGTQEAGPSRHLCVDTRGGVRVMENHV